MLLWKGMLTKKLKSTKQGQAVLEFAACASVLLFMTLGLFDYLKYEIVKTEIDYLFRSNLALLASSSSCAQHQDCDKYAKDLKKKIRENTFFCTEIDGQTNPKGACSKTKSEQRVKVTKLSFFGVVSVKVKAKQDGSQQAGSQDADVQQTNGQLNMGNLACLSANIEYYPTMKGIVSNKDGKLSSNVVTCVPMETQGASVEKLKQIYTSR